MTKEERIKSILSEVKHGFISYDNLNGCDENGNFYQGLEIIKEALEKADKYAWHDLRKNPDDLPKSEHEVDIAYLGYDGKTIHTARAIYEDGTVHTEESSECWNECEFIFDEENYCEETDDYIIPELWCESGTFCETYGLVDRQIIAWREIEPFEEV